MSSLNYNQSEQWILFKALDNILTYHSKDRFKNFIQIISENPELVFNRIFACRPDVAEFYLNLTPLQRGYLQPQVRLFRVKGNKEYEIAFASTFNAQEFREMALASSDFNIEEPGRLDGSAIKRISISEKPERPSDVNLLCKIELYFDNIIALFNSNVLELITLPERKVQFDSKDFRIKLMLGWNVPTDSGNSVFTPEQRAIIAESNIVYLLELSQHNLNFRDNGAVDLNIEYHGAVESQMKNQKTYDIFKIDLYDERFRTLSPGNYNSELRKGVEEKLESSVDGKLVVGQYWTVSNEQDVANFQSQIEWMAKDEYTDLTVKKENLTKELEEIQKQDSQIALNEVKSQKNDRVDKIREELSQIDARLGDLEILVIRDKYAKILEILLSSNRIFYLPIPPEIFVELGAIDKKIREDADRPFTTTDKNKMFETIVKAEPVNLKYTDEQSQEDYLKFFKAFKELLDDLKVVKKENDLKNLDDDSIEQRKQEAVERALYNLRNAAVTNAQKHNLRGRRENIWNFNVYYFLLGDLLDIVMHLAGLETTDINIILGPFRYGNKIINLSQIPIALTQFSTFFLNKVIKTAKKSYFLWDFIQDVITDLIIPQITGDNLTLPKMPNLNVTSTTVLSTNQLDRGIVYSDTGLANLLSRSYFQGKQIYKYLVIYCRTFDLPYRIGSQVQDAKDGIYHFGIGRGSGVVKSINFSKIDQPKVRDARLTGDELNRAGKVLKEYYNCKMSAIGNPIFIPGAHFYFDGSYLGAKGKKATDILGLGGYYMINSIDSTFTPGKFDMEIDGFWQSVAKPLIEPAVVIGLSAAAVGLISPIAGAGLIATGEQLKKPGDK